MTEWAPRRFWTDVGLTDTPHGVEIRLDDRPVRTPAKAPLVVPSRALAEAIAAEWAAQQEQVDPRSMPFTKTANSAIDNVAKNHAAVAEIVAAYGASDLLCYRADGPAELVARQAAAWDPLLHWAETALAARLTTAGGIMHVAQPESSLQALSARVHGLDPFRLAALHDLVALSGSLILGLAVLERYAAAEALWDLSRIDELWQQEHWGADEEAAAMAAAKRSDFLHAAAVLEHLDQK